MSLSWRSCVYIRSLKRVVLAGGAIYGFLSVLLGAFGAHAFKALLSPEHLQSFQVGVRYQMIHALLLLILGFYFRFESWLERGVAISVLTGTFLFSFSIYFLSFANYWNVNLKMLGPVTPLGGLFLLAGWLLLIVTFVKYYK